MTSRPPPALDAPQPFPLTEDGPRMRKLWLDFMDRNKHGIRVDRLAERIVEARYKDWAERRRVSDRQ